MRRGFGQAELRRLPGVAEVATHTRDLNAKRARSAPGPRHRRFILIPFIRILANKGESPTQCKVRYRADTNQTTTVLSENHIRTY